MTIDKQAVREAKDYIVANGLRDNEDYSAMTLARIELTIRECLEAQLGESNG